MKAVTVFPSVATESLTRSSVDVRRRALWSGCVAHVLHDGYTDVIYVLLPVWQTEFALGFQSLAMIRALYAATMAGLQWPAGRLAERFGARAVLPIGTMVAALGFLLAGFSGGLLGLGAALTLSGSGSSAQHPIASGTISRVYGKDARGPLGIYNFAGDLGKAAFPAAASLLLILMVWRHALWIMSFVGLIVAAILARYLPTTPAPAPGSASTSGDGSIWRKGFSLLLTIGVLDTGVRMGFLIFLPFLLKAKGASLPMIGASLSLIFVGGAGGKFICGWLGARVGAVKTVLVTEGGTAACILAVLFLPLTVSMLLLPLLGLMLNGTSSVLYGTVPELAPTHRTERAFALFYSGTIGSGAIAPILYGMLGDWVGVRSATIATAVTALMIVPFAIALSPCLAREAR